MNYILSIAADAIADLKELDIWLQEALLDELDDVLTTLQPNVDGPGEMIYDFERIGEHYRHVVFVHLLRDSANRKLVVLGIGHHAISLP